MGKCSQLCSLLACTGSDSRDASASIHLAIIAACFNAGLLQAELKAATNAALTPLFLAVAGEQNETCSLVHVVALVFNSL